MPAPRARLLSRLFSVHGALAAKVINDEVLLIRRQVQNAVDLARFLLLHDDR